MFTHPYETTVCAGYSTVLNNIKKAIAAAEVSEGLTRTIEDANGKVVANFTQNVSYVTDRNKEVPPFAHPIQVEFPSYSTVVVDVRSCTSTDRTGRTYVNSRSEFDFAVLRGKLTAHMIYDSAKDLQNVGQFPMLVFGRWMAEGVSKRHGLNPADQLRFAIIASFYYLSLFKADPVMTEDELNKQSQIIAKNLYAPIEMCLEIADQLLPMRGIGDFCNMVTTILSTSRLEKFTTGLLYTDLMNSWFGTNAREIVCVALEHPPTWLALLHSALNERTYKNSQLSKVALANDKKEAGKIFNMNIKNLIS